MTQIAIMTALLLAAPTASARIIAGFEFCNTGSCNGWVFGEDGDENSHNVYFSPTGGNSCNNNTVNFGFAVVGNNNMCNSSAACEQCSVTAPKNTGAACDHYPETCFIHGRTPVLP